MTEQQIMINHFHQMFYYTQICFTKPSSIQQNIDKINKINQNTGFDLDIEENSPFQEGIISETIQRLDKSFSQNPTKLEDLIDMGNLIHTFLPKQADIDKLLYIIQRKALKGTHLPVEIKEIKAGYYIALTLKVYTNIYCKKTYIPNWP